MKQNSVLVQYLLDTVYRTGVRHVRGVRPNRAADFSGPAILASFI